MQTPALLATDHQRNDASAPAAPVLTMFSHPDMKPWMIAGQANIIFQAHPGFHSPYSGPNSLHGRGEYKTSLLGTVYTGYAWHYNSRYETDFIVDMESSGGRGLSEALGLAGFTNIDVVRNPNLGSAPYLARGEILQVIGLTSNMAQQDRDPFDLATKVPARRLEVRVGKMSLPDQFDTNEVGSDSHLQFMNWTVDNNGAWDYAADTRGYTVGGLIEYDSPQWDFRYGIFAMPTVANGENLDWAFSRANGQDWEFDWNHSLIRGRHGVSRILAYVNHAHMGDYRKSVEDYLAGSTPVPEITHTERFGAVKYGFGWNDEQDITNHLRVFSRFGWNPDRHESFAYTEVGQSVEVGGDYNGAQWGRPVDKIGFAFVSNAIKKDHQNYLKFGGLGFILGDGRLNYGRENIIESYYNLHAWRGLYYALDVQHINNPGYNRDRGPVWVFAVRGHVDF
jgi:high affinity Mn2+ porin